MQIIYSLLSCLSIPTPYIRFLFLASVKRFDNDRANYYYIFEHNKTKYSILVYYKA